MPEQDDKRKGADKTRSVAPNGRLNLPNVAPNAKNGLPPKLCFARLARSASIAT